MMLCMLAALLWWPEFECAEVLKGCCAGDCMEAVCPSEGWLLAAEDWSDWWCLAAWEFCEFAELAELLEGWWLWWLW
jgi:hypothetical protein